MVGRYGCVPYGLYTIGLGDVSTLVNLVDNWGESESEDVADDDEINDFDFEDEDTFWLCWRVLLVEDKFEGAVFLFNNFLVAFDGIIFLAEFLCIDSSKLLPLFNNFLPNNLKVETEEIDEEDSEFLEDNKAILRLK